MFDICAGLPNCNTKPLVKSNDPLQLGVVLEFADGRETFTVIKSGQTYDELRPFLQNNCRNIDVSNTQYINAYWDVRPVKGEFVMRQFKQLMKALAFAYGLILVACIAGYLVIR
jgi:hypothetical protein